MFVEVSYPSAKVGRHPIDDREPWNDGAVAAESGARVAAHGEARARWLWAPGYEGYGVARWGTI